MQDSSQRPRAIYDEVSTEHGLHQDFKLAGRAIRCPAPLFQESGSAGWTIDSMSRVLTTGGYSGGSRDRPDLQRLLDDIRALRNHSSLSTEVDRLKN